MNITCAQDPTHYLNLIQGANTKTYGTNLHGGASANGNN